MSRDLILTAAWPGTAPGCASRVDALGPLELNVGSSSRAGAPAMPCHRERRQIARSASKPSTLLRPTGLSPGRDSRDAINIPALEGAAP